MCVMHVQTYAERAKLICEKIVSNKNSSNRDKYRQHALRRDFDKSPKNY